MAWRGCVLRWAREDIISTATRGNRFTLNTQQRCGFRKAAKETTTKKGALEETGPLHTEPIEGLIHRRGASPHVEPSVEYTHPRHFGRLVKPLVFTIGFTACSFGTAAIWQYESLKSRVQSYVNEVRADWLEKLWPQKRGSSQMDQPVVEQLE
ncbi:hypothetical protein J4Q44_G00332500 [Coregonus suidteri]|uniref:Uncharacterized protein n=1 Tax=Coregonus suidteri TaxID=861788 RepID=A0AAN8QHP5_9TELE